MALKLLCLKHIKNCLKIFAEDFKIEIENLDNINNFEKVINILNSLKKKLHFIPFYLKGFMKYFDKINQKKIFDN